MPISVIFAGTPSFAVPSLEALIADPAFDVRLVITQPDKPVGRKQILTPSPVKVCAEKHGIEVVQPENINNYEFQIMNYEFLVVVAYGQLLKQPLLDQPSIAAVNVHPSLLPLWRGATPMQSVLLAGDTVTGVTIQKMTLQLDAGDILSQKESSIHTRETLESLHDRLADLSATLLVDTLKKPLHGTPQDENAVTICNKLSRKDGEVDPAHMTAIEIDRCVRALVPWPGVTCSLKGNTLKILRTSLEETSNSYPLVCDQNTTLYIEELQPSGKKPMTGVEWARRMKP